MTSDNVDTRNPTADARVRRTLRSMTEEKPSLREASAIFNQLSDEDQEEVLAMMHDMIEKNLDKWAPFRRRFWRLFHLR